MTWNITGSGLVLGLLTLATSGVAAQAPVQSFDELQTALEIGQRVVIRGEDGSATNGRVVSIGGERLELEGVRPSRLELVFASLLNGGFVERSEPSQVSAFSRESVRRIDRVDSLWQGFVIGFAVGLAVDWVVVSHTKDDGLGRATQVPLLVVPPYLGIIAGMRIDGSIRRSIYASPQEAPAVAAPIVSRNRVGVSVAVRF